MTKLSYNLKRRVYHLVCYLAPVIPWMVTLVQVLWSMDPLVHLLWDEGSMAYPKKIVQNTFIHSVYELVEKKGGSEMSI